VVAPGALVALGAVVPFGLFKILSADSEAFCSAWAKNQNRIMDHQLWLFTKYRFIYCVGSFSLT